MQEKFDTDLSTRDYFIIACGALHLAKDKIQEYRDVHCNERKEQVLQIELEREKIKKAILSQQAINVVYLRLLEGTLAQVEEHSDTTVTSQSISTPKRESRSAQLAEAVLSPLSTMSDFSPAVVKIAQRVTRGQKRALDSGDGIDQSNVSNTADGQVQKSVVAKKKLKAKN